MFEVLSGSPEFAALQRRLAADAPRREHYDALAGQVAVATGAPLPGYDEAAALCADPFGEEEAPEAAADLLRDAALLEEWRAGPMLLTFPRMYDSPVYDVWLLERATGIVRFASARRGEDGSLEWSRAAGDGRLAPQDLGIPAEWIVREARSASRKLALASTRAARASFLAALDPQCAAQAAETCAIGLGAALPPPLVYNFLRGAIAESGGTQQARLYARQAVDRWPGLGVLAARLVDDPERGRGERFPFERVWAVGHALARIAGGAAPESAFAPCAPGTSLRFMTGMPAEAVAGLMPKAGGHAALHGVAALAPGQRPASFDEGKLFRELHLHGMVAAASQSGNWKSSADVLGAVPAAELEFLDDYRLWAAWVAKSLARTPEAATQRLQAVGLRRWVEASQRWHEQFPRWLERREAEVLVGREAAAAGAWPALLQPGALERIVPAGWLAAEVLEERSLSRLGAEDELCVGSYAQSCVGGWSRILTLQRAGEPRLTVEIVYDGEFRVAQCSAPGNQVAGPAGQRVAAGLVRALNAELPAEQSGGAAALLAPATMASMAAAAERPRDLVDLRLVRLLQALGPDALSTELAPFLPFTLELALPAPVPPPAVEVDDDLAMR